MKTTDAAEAPPKSKVAQSIDELLKAYRSRAQRNLKMVEWLYSNRAKIEALGFEVSYGVACVDWDKLTHAQAVQVMLAFPGKWEKDKNANGESFDYRRAATGQDPELCCWSAGLGPHCRVVEEVERVPAQPAHDFKVRKIVCDGNGEAANV